MIFREQFRTTKALVPHASPWFPRRKARSTMCRGFSQSCGRSPRRQSSFVGWAQTEQCHHQPIANLDCLGNLVIGRECSASCMRVRPASTSVRSRPGDQISSVAAPQMPDPCRSRRARRSRGWSNVSCGTPKLANRTVDRNGAYVALYLREVGVDVFGRHVSCSGPSGRSKPARSRKPKNCRNAEHDPRE